MFVLYARFSIAADGRFASHRCSGHLPATSPHTHHSGPARVTVLACAVCAAEFGCLVCAFAPAPSSIRGPRREGTTCSASRHHRSPVTKNSGQRACREAALRGFGHRPSAPRLHTALPQAVASSYAARLPDPNRAHVRDVPARAVLTAHAVHIRGANETTRPRLPLYAPQQCTTRYGKQLNRAVAHEPPRDKQTRDMQKNTCASSSHEPRSNAREHPYQLYSISYTTTPAERALAALQRICRKETLA